MERKNGKTKKGGEKMIINWHGPVGASGYGRFTRFLVPAISKFGHNVNVLPIYSEEIRIADPEIKEHINFIDENILHTDASIRLSIANPSDVVGFGGKNRVLYSMLEVDKIPPFWAKALNTVDRVWVPSKWMKKVYKDSGVTTSIDVTPGGVDNGIFNPYRQPISELINNEKFRFLFVGKWEPRKGPDTAIRAFSEEFSEDENVEMIILASSIKMFNPQFNIFQKVLSLKLPSDRPELKIMDNMIRDYRDMGRLYASADCLVNPTKGEGWNLPLIEAMATGLPCITTNHSAHTEYITKDNVIMLNDFELKKMADPEQMSLGFLQFGRWAEPSLKELKEKMRWVFENQDKAKKIGQEALKDIKTKWTWKHAAGKAIKNLEKMIE